MGFSHFPTPPAALLAGAQSRTHLVTRSFELTMPCLPVANRRSQATLGTKNPLKRRRMSLLLSSAGGIVDLPALAPQPNPDGGEDFNSETARIMLEHESVQYRAAA
jgi:hypothetical protein